MTLANLEFTARQVIKYGRMATYPPSSFYPFSTLDYGQPTTTVHLSIRPYQHRVSTARLCNAVKALTSRYASFMCYFPTMTERLIRGTVLVSQVEPSSRSVSFLRHPADKSQQPFLSRQAALQKSFSAQPASFSHSTL